ncbi:histone RNA hairpin-binding protein isoform X2 [Epargyreus clarus]
MKSDSRETSSSRKKSKPNNHGDSEGRSSKQVARKSVELETDPVILQRRQKTIDYGKNTVGYHIYIQKVPIEKRTKEHPKTPDKYLKYSRRSWDTLIKMWRKKLHEYDEEGTNDNDLQESDEGSTI